MVLRKKVNIWKELLVSLAVFTDFKLKDQHDVHTIQTTVLCALPVFLREETSKFFKTCSIEDDSEEPDVDTSVALLTVVRELRGIALQYNPEKISMILENGVVKTILQRFSDAFI
ncbi:hypothetical protein QQF64_006253 [Cirrhinus molitorella]|uniref:Uncharacterized protein n=1 Tax=Cirrhinus molitorella TaxID=172907 RepID=A0ABR3MHQ0_9TELE